MKQISEVDENRSCVVFKYLTKSLLCKRVGVGEVTPLPPHYHQNSSRSVDISLKDDVTVILLLGFSFMVYIVSIDE
jgi:hypothetical protein